MKTLVILSLLACTIFLSGCDKSAQALARVNVDLAKTLKQQAELAQKNAELLIQVSELSNHISKLEEQNTKSAELLLVGKKELTQLKADVADLLAAMAVNDNGRAKTVFENLLSSFPEIKSSFEKQTATAEVKNTEPKIVSHGKEFRSGDGVFVEVLGGRWRMNAYPVGYRKSGFGSEPWLLVMVSIANQSKRPIEMPKFQLVGENDAIYSPSSESYQLSDAIPIGGFVNPNGQNIHTILFEVPKEKKFRLAFVWNEKGHLLEFQPDEKVER